MNSEGTSDDEKDEKSDHNQNKSKAKLKSVDLCNTNSNESIKKTNENEKFNRNQFRRKANAVHRTVSDLYIKNELNSDNNCFDLFDILEEHIHISLYVYYRKIDYHENDYNGLVNGTYENYLKLIPIMMLVDEKNNEVLYEGEYVLDLLLKLLDAIKKQLDILDVNNLLSKIDNVGKVFKSLMIIQHMLRQLAKLKKYLTIRELKSEDVDVKFYADMLFKTVKKQFDKIYYKIEDLDITIDNETLLDKMIEYYIYLYEKRGYFMFEDINRTLIKHQLFMRLYEKEDISMEWLISANHNKYDYLRAFNELPYIDWKQNANYSVGDKVYIYSTKPISAIEFLVEVIETNISSDDVIDDKIYWTDMNEYENGRKHSRYARFKLIERFDKNKITLEDLHNNGLVGNIQGPRKLYDEIGNILEFGQYIHNWLDKLEENKERIKIVEENNRLDDILKTDITNVVIDSSKIYSYSEDLKPKPKLDEKRSNNVYKRSKIVAINALGIANFSCEIDNNHKTFNRKKDGLPYTEPHHLIPMEYQNKFEYSIDIEENIVSLCSNCHNEIHYGENVKNLIEKLYYERKNLLEKKNIYISLETLLSFYDL